jgi:DNA ligase 1
MKSHLPPLLDPDLSMARFDHVRTLQARTGSEEEMERVRDFMNEAIKGKCEGLMLKVLDDEEEGVKGEVEVEGLDLVDEESESLSVEEDEQQDRSKSPTKTIKPKQTSTSRRKPLSANYASDARLFSWLKVKKDYGLLSDSLDLIPVGAWHGMGRKSKWWSPILMAIWNEDEEKFYPMCKCMSGFSDEL